MGSTAEIAERIGVQLREAGQTVTVMACAQAPGADDSDAVIIGSALYVGRWDKTATRYLRAQAASLAGRPTRLFQSGPCGEGAAAEHVATPRAVAKLVVTRWMATGTYAGDFGDGEQIRSWTATFLAELVRGQQGVPLPGP